MGTVREVLSAPLPALEPVGQRQGRKVQGGGQGAGQHGGHGVQGGHSGNDQVDLADTFDGGGQDPGGGDNVGAGQVVVGHNNPGVGPHLQGATHPVLSILRSHGQGDDLAVGLLSQGDGGLDGVLVELVEDVLLAAHEATVLDATLGLDVRNVLDADHDSHGLKVAITAASRH